LASRSSELESHSELEVPRSFPSRVARNCPEKRIAHRRIRLSKARVIGEVEHLRPHLDPHAFFGHKRLVKIQIQVVDAVDAQPGKVARSIPGFWSPGSAKQLALR
jgi:hypothetical protein